ncbi:MAG: hypothetical protein ABIZ80_16575 [Bryobacteraceae bacterium]
MPTETRSAKVTTEELAAKVRSGMVPLGSNFFYFLAITIADEDLKQYLEDPIAALPPSLRSDLPVIHLVLVPYLGKANGRGKDLVEYEPPAEPRQIFSSRLPGRDATTLFFAVKDEEMADYHYSFYGALAAIVASKPKSAAFERFSHLVQEELAAEVHGEVDEQSWHKKQALLRRQVGKRSSKLVEEYTRQAYEDTLTLYLHGICCDIDVETGPRQMPSRHVRKRLELLTALFPPPKGFAVLPENKRAGAQ